MKITLLFRLLIGTIIVLQISACCGKVFCDGRNSEQIVIVLNNVPDSDLFVINMKEYDKSTGTLLDSFSKNDYYIFPTYNTARLIFTSNQADSFSNNKRFFVLNLRTQNDTISNINYQTNSYTINCNHCPGDNEIITNISNFNFTCNGKTYTDTAIITY
jgi:hypothetical protein